jgi:hypothetical protein
MTERRFQEKKMIWKQREPRGSSRREKGDVCVQKKTPRERWNLSYTTAKSAAELLRGMPRRATVAVPNHIPVTHSFGIAESHGG